MRLVVVIPALNEEKALPGVIESIPRVFPGISDVHVLVVDDGSRDRTAQVAREAGAEVVSHPVNRGVGAAFHTGIRRALELDADITVNIDADGQFSPADIPKLIDPILREEADFVTADRFTGEDGEDHQPANMSRVKFWGNKQVSRIISFIAGNRFRDVSCGFRAYSRNALLHLNLIGQFTYTQESFLDLATKGLKIVSVPVNVRYFPERRSRVAGNILRYAWNISGIIFRTYRDHRPIRFFGFLGAAFFSVGLAIDAFTLWHYLAVGSFTPYKAVALAGVYLNSLGVVIWIVGLMADMLDRIRVNQEQIIYMLKRQNYSHDEPQDAPPKLHRRRSAQR